MPHGAPCQEVPVSLVIHGSAEMLWMHTLEARNVNKCLICIADIKWQQTSALVAPSNMFCHAERGSCKA